LTPEKEVGISHGGRGTRSGASIWDGLGWRWSCTIQEAIRIIGFNKGQNLSSPARKVAVSLIFKVWFIFGTVKRTLDEEDLEEESGEADIMMIGKKKFWRRESIVALIPCRISEYIGFQACSSSERV